MKQIAIDTHVHLLASKSQSRPVWGDIQKVSSAAHALGLDGLCITEHIEADAYADLVYQLFVNLQLDGSTRVPGGVRTAEGLTLFPAAELELKNGMNVGVHTDVETLLSLDRGKGFYTLPALYEELIRCGVKFEVVAHHIYWPGKTCADHFAISPYLSAIEVPAKDVANRQRYEALAVALGLPTTGGSDAHNFIQVGACATILETSGRASDGLVMPTFAGARHRVSGNCAERIALSKIYRAGQLS